MSESWVIENKMDFFNLSYYSYYYLAQSFRTLKKKMR